MNSNRQKTLLLKIKKQINSLAGLSRKEKRFYVTYRVCGYTILATVSGAFVFVAWRLYQARVLFSGVGIWVLTLSLLALGGSGGICLVINAVIYLRVHRKCRRAKKQIWASLVYTSLGLSPETIGRNRELGNLLEQVSFYAFLTSEWSEKHLDYSLFQSTMTYVLAEYRNLKS